MRREEVFQKRLEEGVYIVVLFIEECSQLTPVAWFHQANHFIDGFCYLNPVRNEPLIVRNLQSVELVKLRNFIDDELPFIAVRKERKVHIGLPSYQEDAAWGGVIFQGV